MGGILLHNEEKDIKTAEIYLFFFFLLNDDNCQHNNIASGHNNQRNKKKREKHFLNERQMRLRGSESSNEIETERQIGRER